MAIAMDQVPEPSLDYGALVEEAAVDFRCRVDLSLPDGTWPCGTCKGRRRDSKKKKEKKKRNRKHCVRREHELG